MRVKKRIVCILAVILVLTSVLTPIIGVQGAGVADNIGWLIGQGLLNDDFDKDAIKAAPDKIITRQEYISLLMKAVGQKGTKEDFKALKFTDIKKVNNLYEGYIAAAQKAGILKSAVSGGKTYIKPTKNLTRQMAAYYLGRLLGLEIDLLPDVFTDYSKIYKVPTPYVTGLLSADIIEGSGAFQPVGKVSWEEAAGLIKSAFEKGYFKDTEFQIIAGEVKAGKPVSGMELNQPTGLSREEKDGVFYIADSGSNQIKKYSGGKLTVLAGRETTKDESGNQVGGYADGDMEKAAFNRPTAVSLTNEGLLVLDTGNHSIRLIRTTDNKVETYAGTGMAGSYNGLRKTAQFNEPRGMAIADNGEIYIADTGNHCIRKIDSKGLVTTVAGVPGKDGLKDGEDTASLFNRPTGIAVAGNTIYVADTGNQRVRKIARGAVTTVAGSGSERIDDTNDIIGGYQDGAAKQARFNGPVQLAVDSKGRIYVSDSVNGMIRVIEDNRVSTAAGFGKIAGTDAKTIDSCLANPGGMVLSDDNNLYLMDTFYNMLLKVQLSR